MSGWVRIGPSRQYIGRSRRHDQCPRPRHCTPKKNALSRAEAANFFVIKSQACASCSLVSQCCFAGLALIYWAWLPRGREEALALGMVLIILAVPLLLNSVTHLRRQ